MPIVDIPENILDNWKLYENNSNWSSLEKTLPIQIVNKSNNDLPKYEVDGSSGLDLKAYLLNGNITLKPLERALVPTGIYISIPKGYEGQVRPRSGLATKYGITVLNTPGTIDFGYIGQIQIILINLSNEDFIVKSGDRIAQIVFSAVENISWNQVDVLEETERSDGGFGHTGI